MPVGVKRETQPKAERKARSVRVVSGPKIRRYHVSYWLNGERFALDQTFADLFDAQRSALNWIDNGPVGLTRETRISRSINDVHDPSFSETRKYSNYKQRKTIRMVDGDCETCKGRGRITIHTAAIKVRCAHCSGTGEVTTHQPTIVQRNTSKFMQKPSIRLVSDSWEATGVAVIPRHGTRILTTPVVITSGSNGYALTREHLPVTQPCTRCNGKGYKPGTAKGRKAQIACPPCQGMGKQIVKGKTWAKRFSQERAA